MANKKNHIGSVLLHLFLNDTARLTLLFLFCIVTLLIASNPAPLLAATLPSGFTETLIASGLARPTAMEFAPDGRLFVAEQGGHLRIIQNGSLVATSFVTITVDSSGERGLLGVTFDPSFGTNHYVYVYYTATSPTTHNRVSRFTANGNTTDPNSEAHILDLNDLSSAQNHNGGDIHFGADGKLYIGVGENNDSSNSQKLDDLLGKMLRINSDDTIPSDNPTSFPGLGSTSGITRAIWAVGLRNPFTSAFQPGTGRFFINDVGAGSLEEIDDGIAGSNYGWPTCEGVCNPHNANYRDPLFQYAHGSTSTTGCAIAGGGFYNPTTVQFPNSYVGKYFFGDLCSAWIRLFDPSNNTASGFATGASSSLVDLKVGSDGSLYYLARGSGSNTGVVYRINYPGSPPPPPVTVQDNTAAIQYNGWLGVTDAQANGGTYRVSNTTGDKINFRFTGTAITWITRLGPDQGKATVLIDGATKCTCDMYRSSAQPNFAKVFGNLSNVSHSMLIQVLGTKNTNSSDTKIVLDAFKIGTTTRQDTTSSIRYYPWTGTLNSGASGGTYRTSGINGSVARLIFTGTSINWITAKGPKFGKARVVIDSVDRGTVDLYAPTIQWKVALTYSGLSAGQHTIEIRPLRTRNPSATGYLVPVDAFTGPITVAGSLATPIEDIQGSNSPDE